MELESAMTCDLSLERSYLVSILHSLYFAHNVLQIDFTKELMRWITGEGYALIDVNLYPKPFSSTSSSTIRVGDPNLSFYDT
jgi:histone deacetylase 6